MGQQRPRPLRVLVVEDYKDARESLCVLIGIWGHACESAPTGSDAVQKASAFQPDVVFVDIGLPGMDGWQAAREMRKLPRLRDPVFVATTGYSRDVDTARSTEEGFAAHLVKPVDPELLRQLLARLAEERAGRNSDAPVYSTPPA